MAQLQVRRKILKLPKSIVPIAAVDPKGKCVDSPLVSQRKRERFRVSSQGNTQEKKMLSSAMSAAKTTKAHLILHYSWLRSIYLAEFITALCRSLNLCCSCTGCRGGRRGGASPTNGHTFSWLPRARWRGSYSCHDGGGTGWHLEDQTLSMIVPEVLGTLEPQE